MGSWSRVEANDVRHPTQVTDATITTQPLAIAPRIMSDWEREQCPAALHRELLEAQIPLSCQLILELCVISSAY